MRRICIVSPRSYPLLVKMNALSHGGAEAQFKTLGFEFSARGYDVSFIVDDYGQEDHEVIDGIRIYKAGLKYMGGSKREIPASWKRLWNALALADADVYIIKTPRHLLFLLGLFCLLFNKKLIFIGQTDGDADGRFVVRTDGWLSYFMYRIGMAFVDCCVAQTNKQRFGFERIFGKRSIIIKNVLTLPNCGSLEKGGYILWVGNESANKRPGMFVEMAKRLPNLSFRMILAAVANSPGDEGVRASAKSLPNLDYRGFVPFWEISSHFQGSSLLVNTSGYEGFPNTFLQAWQHRTPVISICVDPDDLIKTHGLGRVSGTFDDLCSDVKKLMQNEFERQSAGERALKYVNESHSIETIVPQYLKLFDLLLRGIP